MVSPGAHVQSTLGGHLLAALGYEAGRVGAVAQGDGLHLLSDRHLEIERPTAPAAEGREGVDIGVRDVAAIFAKVGGDTVGAGGDGDLGRAGRIGRAAAAGVPNGCNVVYIDPEAKSAHPANLRLPGSSVGMAASSGGKASAG